MNYKVELTENFKKEAKKLSRKYPSLKAELAELFTHLEQNRTTGTPLGNDVYIKSVSQFCRKIKVKEVVQE